MSERTYHCTTCDLDFPRIGNLATHIQKNHEHKSPEDELERLRRRALNLPDDDEDEDDDEAEDELLPSSPRAAERKVAHVRRVSGAMIAERNMEALEAISPELERLQTHWELCAELLKHRSREIGHVRELVSWVVHDACESSS